MPTTRNLFSGNRLTTLVALVGTASLGSCLQAPEYPVVPEIGFEALRIASLPPDPTNPRGQRRDTVTLQVNFRDGDGDLGLDSGVDGAPARNPDGTPNLNGNNCFIEPLRKNPATGAFEKLPVSVVPPGEYNGRYPRLTPNGTDGTKAAPIKGVLTRGFGFGLGQPFLPGDEVRFQVTIADRALHLSNTITTESIIVPR